jgi:HPt (histidine-containing phosphotransfer) domain-containing protein
MSNDKAPRLQVETFSDHHVITPANPLRRVLRRVDDSQLDDPIARAEQALANLSGEFVDWMTAECARLAAAHDVVVSQGFTTAGRDELFRAAHDIKGHAATFGYPTAGIAAESLCRILEHAPDLSKVPADLIANHIKAIHAIVREHSQIDKLGVEHELSQRLRLVADEYLTAANHDRPEILDAIMAPSLAPRG